MREIYYLLVDPVGSADGGICTYTQGAESALKCQSYMDVESISILPREPLAMFKSRIVALLKDKQSRYGAVWVEVPETYAIANDLKNQLTSTNVHVRLHCSRTLGQEIQGFPCDAAIKSEELEGIVRADWISAPSVAALKATGSVFALDLESNYKDRLSIYPNPEPSDVFYKQCYSREGILFVGRWHGLKGIDYISRAIRSCPKIHFTIVSTDVPNNIAKSNNVTVLDGRNWNKSTVYSKAKAVVLPSLYETASMVGLEAVKAGTPLITWAHNGICEYEGSGAITALPPFDEVALRRSIQEAVDGNRSLDSNLVVTDCFNVGVSQLVKGVGGNYMPASLSWYDHNAFEQVLKLIRANKTMANLRFFRKLKKLVRNPGLFWRDSLLRRFFRAGRGVVGANNDLVGSALLNNANLEVRDVLNSLPGSLFVNIDRSSNIVINEPEGCPKGTATLLLCPSGTSKGLLEGKLRKILEFPDFNYLNFPRLKLGEFEFGQSDFISILDRMDVNSKNNLSKFDHILMVNPDVELLSALRSAGTNQRLIAIFEEWAGTELAVEDVDVLVVPGEAEVAQNYRRVIRYADGYMHHSIRRAVQEGVPKETDYFLPLRGFSNGDPEYLLNLDARYFQVCLIMDDSFDPEAGMNVVQLCNYMAEHTEEIAVLESVYLKYKTLCDAINRRGVLSDFFLLSIRDGVIFDVRT